jgi:NitT/TauT family transport system ATP-binding protein
MEEGELLALCGPSGIGKTTLLKCIAGLFTPDAGRIVFRGEEVKGPDPSRIMVFQEHNQLFPWKKVRGNVQFGKKFGQNPDDGEIMPYLRMVGLEQDAEKYPFQLSGGMKQRAAVARSLAAEPGLLLMDEPFGSVDWTTRRQLQRMLLSVWKQTGVSIIFVTHDIREAVLLSDRIILFGSTGEIRIFGNSLPRPRDPGSGPALDLVHEIFDYMEKRY